MLVHIRADVHAVHETVLQANKLPYILEKTLYAVAAIYSSASTVLRLPGGRLGGRLITLQVVTCNHVP